MKAPLPRQGFDGWRARADNARVSAQADADADPGRWPRRAVHAVAIVLGWGLFFWGWGRVTASRPELGELRMLMLGALLVVPVLTLGWVAHNVGIYKRKGPRRAVHTVPLRYEHDFAGRAIDADWAELAAARRVVITTDGEHKRFRAAS